MKYSKFLLFSVIIFVFFPQFFDAETPAGEEDQILSIENSAIELSKQWNSESIRSSIALFLEASENWLLAEKPAKAASCLHEASRLHVILGENESSLNLLNSALKISVSNDLSIEKSRSESLLSIVYQKVGNKTKSKEFLDHALKDSFSTGDTQSIAMANFSAAEFYYTQNEFKRSIDYYQKSFDLWNQLGNSQRQAESLVYCAYVHMVLGEPIEGLDKAKQAESIFTEIKDIRGLKLSEIAIGHLLSAMDSKQSALNYYQKANKGFPDDLDLSERAALFNGLGLIYEDYGEYDLSLSYREKALALFQRERYLYGQLASMHSLIKLNYLQRDIVKAEFYTNEAKRLAARLKDNYFLAVVYKEIGDHFFNTSSDQLALEYYKKSLQNSRSTGYKSNIALVLARLGTIYLKRGHLILARKNLQESLEISRKIINRFSEAQTLFGLARLDFIENKSDKALEEISESIEITESLSSNVLNSKLKQTYFSNVFERYELYIALLMDAHQKQPDAGYAFQALLAAERSRSRTTLETLALANANFASDADPDLIRREREIRGLLNLKSDKLSELLGGNADRSEIAEIDREIDQLEFELEEIKSVLKQNSPIYAAIREPSAVNIAEFQNQGLDENTVLLEYSLGEKQSYLWLVGKNNVKSFILPARSVIESTVESLREFISARVRKTGESIEEFQTRITIADREYPELARKLSLMLFGPIHEEISGKRLIIVPDGKLHYFPISALPLPNSELNEPLLLSNEVIYQPSVSTLAILMVNEKKTNSGSKDILIFTDPVFSKSDSRFSIGVKSNKLTHDNTPDLNNFREIDSMNSFPRLAYSKDEGDSISKIAGNSHADIFTGFSATREQFLNSNFSQYRILHLATHGLIDETRPELSGIVFSRFDKRRQRLNEFVRLHDIYSLKINADLVVLSACETSVGKDVRGEGLLSLNNGFLQIGAKSVLSTLWKVDDKATLQFMQIFYGILGDEDITVANALRKTQIEMRETRQFESPYYWAAFTLQGDFRQKPDISRRFSRPMLYFGIGILIITLCGASFYLLRSQRT